MKKNEGFSIIELLVVMVIIGVIASIGVLAWQRYVDNTNLRTAAREIVTDFDTMKRRATSQYTTAGGVSVTPTYKMIFYIGGNNYTMNSITNDGTGDTVTVFGNKALSDFGHGISIKSYGGAGTSYPIEFTSRGIMNPSTGNIVLQNGRGSEAKITFNLTGKIYVKFSMQ